LKILETIIEKLFLVKTKKYRTFAPKLSRKILKILKHQPL
jgi:hypothetical protein